MLNAIGRVKYTLFSSVKAATPSSFVSANGSIVREYHIYEFFCMMGSSIPENEGIIIRLVLDNTEIWHPRNSAFQIRNGPDGLE